MGVSVFDEQIPYTDFEKIDNAWGLSHITVIGNTNDRWRLDTLILTSNDVVDHDVQLWSSYSGAAQSLIGTVSVPAGAGTTSLLPPVEAVAILLPGRGFVGEPRDGLAIGPVVAVTAGKFIYATILGAQL